MENNCILSMKGIIKAFPGVKALNNVNFSVTRGEVHALMGENGAGKSTLVKILMGVYQPDQGEIIFDGKKAEFQSPLAAGQSGLSCIFQELNMIPYLSVSENIFLGRYPKDKSGIDWKKMHADAKRLIDDLSLKIDVKTPLNELGAASQQMVSIVRAISIDSKLVIMDEPTSSLNSREVDMLFDIIKKLKSKGISIIFISHRMSEIYEICDRITVLKDGEFIGTYDVCKLSKHQLITKMIGREIDETKRLERRNPLSDDSYIVELENLAKFPKVVDVSFGIKKGEVLGLAGLLGSGRTEIIRLLYGLEKPDSGKIKIDGKDVKFKSPAEALLKGFAFCTEDRRTEGIIPNMSIMNNIALCSLDAISKNGLISRKKRKEMSDFYIDKFKIATPSAGQRVKLLSGGNQQKVLLARGLAINPKLIILDEPTRGIDVGAKQQIELQIRAFAEMGISVLFISSIFTELVRNCDRIIVIREGEVVGEVLGDELLNEDVITKTIAES